MTAQFQIAIAVTVVAASVTGLGIIVIRRFTAWGKRNALYFISFAAGLLISASFLHLVPAALSTAEHAPFWIVTGFFGMHLFNRFFSVLVCERDPQAQELIFGIVPMIGIGFHSFIDGFVHSVTFSASIFTGLVSAAGMVLHEFPEGIITYLLLVHSGFGTRKAAILAFIAAGISTPLGMLISWPFVSQIEGHTLGALLGLSAGALAYVGATHLLPKVEQEPGGKSVLALSGGILIAIIIVISGH